MPTVAPTSASALGNSGTSIGSPVVWNPSGVAFGNSSIPSGKRGTGTPRDDQKTFTNDEVTAPSVARSVTRTTFAAEADHREFTFTNDEVKAPSQPRTPTRKNMPGGAHDSDGGLY